MEVSNMPEKNQAITNYITNISKQLNEQYKGIMPDEKIQEAIEMFQNSSENLEDIIKKINELTEQVIKNYIEESKKRCNSELVKKNHEEILEAAKKAGFTMVGFSEHISKPSLVLPDEDRRMLLSEVDEYISSINTLKQKNPRMTILSGFETEYDPMKESFLGEMRDKVDYMLLRQHFISRG